MDTTIFVGSIGAAIILIFFLLNQTHTIEQDDVRYDVANALGSALLLFYAYSIVSWPFFVINLVWTLASLKDVVKKLR